MSNKKRYKGYIEQCNLNLKSRENFPEKFLCAYHRMYASSKVLEAIDKCLAL